MRGQEGGVSLEAKTLDVSGESARGCLLQLYSIASSAMLCSIMLRVTEDT